MNPKVKIKGSMSDLKTPLLCLKILMEEAENIQDKMSMEEHQEADLQSIKDRGSQF